MKTRLAVLLACAATAACTQSGTPSPARLTGTNSSVVAGSLLFVTSTGTNELRVLDLVPSSAGLDFVRAPNPLNSLSIPTLPSPVELAAPTRYGPLGQPLQGDWVFARGAGNSAVSIIAAVNCPQQLREFGRIAPRPDSVVTALASRLTSDDRLAQLYFTTFDGNQTTLWELLLPNLARDRSVVPVPASACPAYPFTLPSYSLRPVGLFQDKVVTAMVALPTVQHPGAAPDPEERRLVIGLRLIGSPPLRQGTMTSRGEIQVVIPLESALIIDPIQAVFNSNTTVAESFPIKRVVTHGNVVNLVPPSDGGTITIDADGGVSGGLADVVMDAGTRIFAVMDEASCGGSADCVGVLAVDLDRTATLIRGDGGGTTTGYPVAIDGFDNLRDVVDPTTGLPVLLADGGIFQAGDTFYRSPATFPDGGPRDANRMLVIRFGNNTTVGIVQDVVVQAAGWAQYVDGFQRQYGLLGHVTITGFGNSTPLAQIFAFDGMTLRQINYARTATATIQQTQAILGNGSPADFQGGPQRIDVGVGIFPYSEPFDTTASTATGGVAVQYEGIVAGIVYEPLDAGLGAPGEGIWPLTINSRVAVENGYVQPGDIVVPVDSTNTECQYAFPILPGEDGGVLDLNGGAFLHTRTKALASVIDGGLLDGGGVLTFPDGTPVTIADCPSTVSFRVRSSSLAAQPFTVIGLSSGWLGRLGIPPPPAGTTVFTVGENTNPKFVRFWRPSVDAGASASNLTQVGFTFALDYADAGVDPLLTGGDIYGLRGSGYVMHFLNGYTPASVSLSSATLQVPGLNLPGALALYQPQIYPTAVGADRIFVLYPGGNVIVDFSPTTVSYSVPNTAFDIGVHF